MYTKVIKHANNILRPNVKELRAAAKLALANHRDTIEADIKSNSVSVINANSTLNRIRQDLQAVLNYQIDDLLFVYSYGICQHTDDASDLSVLLVLEPGGHTFGYMDNNVCKQQQLNTGDIIVFDNNELHSLAGGRELFSGLIIDLTRERI